MMKEVQPVTVLTGDCLTQISTIQDGSIKVVITSPPYAEQRKAYNGIPEKEYPAWMVSVCEAIRPKLTPDGSILINIRTSIKDGVISDYVLRTRLALRDAGFKENEELIWYKPDSPPWGSTKRPRRVYENILWFSNTKNPYVNLKAAGASSERIGFSGAPRYGVGGTSHFSGISDHEYGTSRVTDVFIAYMCDNDKGIMHPAIFPPTLVEQLIQTFTKEGDTVLDPFAGSGTTLLVARKMGRKSIGIELSPEYVAIIEDRLQNDEKYRPRLASLSTIFD